ncbi:hypothetical protein A2U01_0088736, partial [Trifolium medium]|nr:hypothetical protein [Trifolium medium]
TDDTGPSRPRSWKVHLGQSVYSEQ